MAFPSPSMPLTPTLLGTYDHSISAICALGEEVYCFENKLCGDVWHGRVHLAAGRDAQPSLADSRLLPTVSGAAVSDSRVMAVAFDTGDVHVHGAVPRPSAALDLGPATTICADAGGGVRLDLDATSSRLVTGGSSAVVRVWDVATGQMLSRVEGAPLDRVTATAFARGSGMGDALFAVAAADGYVRLRDARDAAASGPEVHLQDGAVAWSLCMGSEDAQACLFGCDDGSLRVADWRAPSVTVAVRGAHAGEIHALAATTDASGVPLWASGGDDGKVRAWRQGGAALQEVPRSDSGGARDYVRALCGVDGGFVSGSWSGELVRWSL